MRGSRIVFGSLICRWLRPPPFFFKFLWIHPFPPS
jgi:hypothetical protein